MSCSRRIKPRRGTSAWALALAGEPPKERVEFDLFVAIMLK